MKRIPYLLSGSKVALFQLCTHFAFYEPEPNEDRSSSYARFGLAVHAAHEDARAGKAPDLAAIADRFTLDEAQRLALPGAVTAVLSAGLPPLAVAEVTFAWSWQTGEARELGQGLNRRYVENGLRDDEIPLTVDLVWMKTETAPDGTTVTTVVVADLKTGFFSSLLDHEPQLLTAAFVARKAYRADRAIVMTLPIRNGEVAIDMREAPDFELDAFEEDLFGRIHAAIPASPPRVGDHCAEEYCPVFQRCEAARATLAQATEELLPASALVRPLKLSGPIANAEEATFRRQVQPLLKKLVDTNDKLLKEWADAHGGIAMADGSGVWRKRLEVASYIVPTPEALAVLEEELGPAYSEAVKQSIDVSAASIERAVQVAGIKPIGKTVERIVERIAAVGGTSPTTRAKYAVVKGA